MAAAAVDKKAKFGQHVAVADLDKLFAPQPDQCFDALLPAHGCGDLPRQLPAQGGQVLWQQLAGHVVCHRHLRQQQQRLLQTGCEGGFGLCQQLAVPGASHGEGEQLARLQLLQRL